MDVFLNLYSVCPFHIHVNSINDITHIDGIVLISRFSIEFILFLYMSILYFGFSLVI